MQQVLECQCAISMGKARSTGETVLTGWDQENVAGGNCRHFKQRDLLCIDTQADPWVPYTVLTVWGTVRVKWRIQRQRVKKGLGVLPAVSGLQTNHRCDTHRKRRESMGGQYFKSYHVCSNPILFNVKLLLYITEFDYSKRKLIRIFQCYIPQSILIDDYIKRISTKFPLMFYYITI